MKRSAGNGGHGAEQDERGNKMKARQYFEKHRQEMTCGDEKKVQAAINQLVLELNDEAKDMLKSRNVYTDRAAVSVLRELNDKYNAVVGLFEKHYGASPLMRDGYLNLWKNRMPTIQQYLRQDRGF